MGARYCTSCIATCVRTAGQAAVSAQTNKPGRVQLIGCYGLHSPSTLLLSLRQTERASRPGHSEYRPLFTAVVVATIHQTDLHNSYNTARFGSALFTNKSSQCLSVHLKRQLAEFKGILVLLIVNTLTTASWYCLVPVQQALRKRTACLTH